MSQKTCSATESTSKPDTGWLVYIIASNDNRLYTGITNNLTKRWHAHMHTRSGAKFFRGRKPERLLYVEDGFNRSTASKREFVIKKLMRAEKLLLIETQQEIDWHSKLKLTHKPRKVDE